MSDKISYTEQELADMTVQNHFLLKAHMSASSLMFHTIGEILKPGAGKKWEEMFEKTVQEMYKAHLADEPRLEDFLLRQKLKDELGDLTFE